MLWSTADSAPSWVTGYATSDSGVLTGAHLLGALEAGRSPREFGGSFAAVLRDASCLRIISDRHGSVPLYMARVASAWAVGDDAAELCDLLADAQLDPEACVEMLAFKYVLGGRTLYRGIEEVPPGSIVTLGDSTPRVQQVWRHTLREESGRRRRDIVAGLAGVLDEVAERQAEVGNQIGLRRWGVNLTAGRDSRVIAAFAKRSGQLAACFTSRLDNEVEVAGAVAGHLGIPFVSFDPWLVDPVLGDGTIAKKLAPTTTFHVAGHPLALAATGPWPVDGYVSGHLGDVYAGSHFSLRYLRLARELSPAALGDNFAYGQAITKPSLLADILNPDYLGLAKAPHTRMLSLFSETEGHTPLGRLLQLDIEQRQRRFILRDYAALRTLGPTLLWFADHAWVDYWSSVPLKWQVGTPLYETVLKERIFTGNDLPLASLPANGRDLRRVRRPSARLVADDFSRRLRKKIGALSGRPPTVSPVRLLSEETIDAVSWLCRPERLRRGDLPSGLVNSLETIALVAKQIKAGSH